MSRVVDRAAVVAGWIGAGMAVTIVVSFLLVIPIEPVVWLLAPFAGLVIGYYANSRADRRQGPWSRILANGAWAGLVTAVAMAGLMLATKAIFFVADDGYRDASGGGPIAGCHVGADCVYQRYLQAGRGPDFAHEGVTDVSSFTAFYWREQLGTAGIVFVLCAAGGVAGAAAYGAVRPRAGVSTVST